MRFSNDFASTAFAALWLRSTHRFEIESRYLSSDVVIVSGFSIESRPSFIVFFFYRIALMRYDQKGEPKTMTALDDIEELDRATRAANRKLVRALALEERSEKLAGQKSALRDTLLDAPADTIAFYKMTDLLTRRMNTTDAVAVWKKTRRTLLAQKRQWAKVEKFGEPDIDGIVAHYCKVLGDLAEKALREYRSYAETAYLLDSPANERRLADALYESATGRAGEMTLEELALPSGARS